MAIPLIPFAVFLLLIVLFTYKYILYPALLSPLSSIPAAHPIAKFSGIWILWQRFKGRNNRTTYVAHQKYGDIVRLGPSELSVNCVDGGIRTIYAGGFEKHEWYERLFPSFGVMNMFSILHHAPHSAKKRTMANIYSKSFLQSSEQVKANSVVLLRDRFLPQLQACSETGKEVDMHDLNNAFTMDFMSAYQYGLANSTDMLRDVESRRKFLEQYHCRRDYDFYSAEVPQLKTWSRMLGSWRLVPELVEMANEDIEQWLGRMSKGADSYLGQLTDPGDEPVVYKQFKSGWNKMTQKALTGEKQPPAEAEYNARVVDSEMLDHLAAGHETSAIALTYLYLEMSRRPQLQERLRAEIKTLQPKIIWPPTQGSAFTLPDPKQIDTLPLLHAILMETLRLHAPIPGMEPRITPASGCTLAGYANIPGGVRVSAMPYCLHRNESVFPDPEAWKPERWLVDPQSEAYKEMMRWFWAFGSGGRMCIGSHLAMQEIKLVVCAVYGNWRTEVAEGGDVDVEEVDAYTTKPKSNRLGLRFRRP